eukprot:s1895_g22.t1
MSRCKGPVPTTNHKCRRHCPTAWCQCNHEADGRQASTRWGSGSKLERGCSTSLPDEQCGTSSCASHGKHACEPRFLRVLQHDARHAQPDRATASSNEQSSYGCRPLLQAVQVRTNAQLTGCRLELLELGRPGLARTSMRCGDFDRPETCGEEDTVNLFPSPCDFHKIF